MIFLGFYRLRFRFKKGTNEKMLAVTFPRKENQIIHFATKKNLQAIIGEKLTSSHNLLQEKIMAAEPAVLFSG